MLRKFLRSKIHRATVTQADLHYEGSLTLPPELLDAAKIAPYESVHVWNVTRGTRLETYAILGEPGSHDVCINGAAAHLVSPGDIVIIATFGFLTDEPNGLGEPNRLTVPEPTVVFVDSENRIAFYDSEVPGPRTRNLHEPAHGSTNPERSLATADFSDSNPGDENLLGEREQVSKPQSPSSRGCSQ